MSDERVTAEDIRAAGYCIHIGARRWCAHHGVDFRRLMTEGIPVDEIAGIDDALVQNVLRTKQHGIK